MVARGSRSSIAILRSPAGNWKTNRPSMNRCQTGRLNTRPSGRLSEITAASGWSNRSPRSEGANPRRMTMVSGQSRRRSDESTPARRLDRHNLSPNRTLDGGQVSQERGAHGERLGNDRRQVRARRVRVRQPAPEGHVLLPKQVGRRMIRRVAGRYPLEGLTVVADPSERLAERGSL